jgi:galactose mutarotase-like enzyme
MRVTTAERGHAAPGDLEVTYALTADGLTLAIGATTLGDRAAPFGAGFHPCLTLGDARIDGALLELPDAFNSGDGLLVLEPGETFSGRPGLRAEGS